MAMPTAEAVSVGLGEPRGHTELVLEMIALRHQIAVLKRSGTCVWRISGLCRKSVIRYTGHRVISGR
jgi:hypothetical protein